MNFVATPIYAAKVIRVKKSKKRKLSADETQAKNKDIDQDASFYLSCLHKFNKSYTKVNLQKGNRTEETDLKKSLNDLYKEFQIQHVQKPNGNFSFTKGIKPNTVKFLTENGEYLCKTNKKDYKEIKKYDLTQLLGASYKSKKTFDKTFKGTAKGVTSCRKIEKTHTWRNASIEYTKRIFDAYLTDKAIENHYTYYKDFAKDACIKESDYKKVGSKKTVFALQRIKVKSKIEPLADLQDSNPGHISSPSIVPASITGFTGSVQ